MLKKFLLTLVATLFATQLFAMEHPPVMGTIKGDNIDLKLFDHAISGNIGNLLVLGNKDDRNNSSYISFIQAGNPFIFNFFPAPGRFGGGGMTPEWGTSQLKPTTVELRAIVPTEKMIILHVDKRTTPQFNADIAFKITADDFVNNHFINPTYTATLPNGKVLEIKVSNGQACYNFSTHLLHMIMSVYVQTL
ncbi:MAG: hypothetical protein U0T83_04355 [Bacteriovoracaceae bacterium]